MDQVKFVEDRYGLLTNIFLLALFMALKLFLPALAIGLHNVFNNLIYWVLINLLQTLTL